MRSRARPAGREPCGGDRPGKRPAPGAVLAVLPAAILLAAAGCARQERPPGAEVDNSPPRLVSSRPEDGAVVPGLDDPLTLRFDEPVEENPSLQRDLRASPADRYRVDFGFSDIEIEPRGGWREGAVYFFHVPAPLTDLLGNRTERAIEITFSTGPPIPETRVEGTVLDRVTGRPARTARVLFYRRDGDSVPYTAVQDTGDAFGLRALPPGSYRAYAFRDLNRNRRLEDRLEAHDSTTFVLDGPDASVSLEFRLVEPDSTPPILVSASPRDSQLVELQFDDHLDPGQDFGRAAVAVRDTATGRRWPVDAVGLTAGRDTTPLPSRTAIARLGRALEDGGVYRVRADSFLNLRHLAGGGDTLFVYSAPADTAGAAPGGGGAAAGRRPE